jgi:hypothetical protein
MKNMIIVNAAHWALEQAGDVFNLLITKYRDCQQKNMHRSQTQELEMKKVSAQMK